MLKWYNKCDLQPGEDLLSKRIQFLNLLDFLSIYHCEIITYAINSTKILRFMTGVETAQALPNSQVYHAFVRIDRFMSC